MRSNYPLISIILTFKVNLVVVLLVGNTLWATQTIRAASDESNDSANDSSRSHFQYEFLVLGMSCEGCAKSAEKELKSNIRNILKPGAPRFIVGFDSVQIRSPKSL